MKVVTPEISWHQRDPIYSVDFQPGVWSIQRIASGGVDKIVRIWQMTLDSDGKGQVDFLSNLRRHTAAVNVVRFSRNGELLATAGDDSTIILWKLNDVPTPANSIFAEDDVDEDKESWVCHKTLRGHLGDVVDLSWSKDNNFLVSGSVDNCAILWDVTKAMKVALFKEHKSYVQGVAFDPLGTYVATLSADRSLRLYNLNSKNCVHNISKMTLPPIVSSTTTSPNAQNPPETKPKQFRIFHDDSLRSFFRRLEFSPDGQLLIAPAGCMELGDNKVINASFVFARGAFSKPAVYLPSPEKTTTVVKANPQLFELRPADNYQAEPATDNTKVWEKNKSLFCLPYRIVFAVATEDSVLIYDTQQTMPIGLLKNVHYHQISDLSWTSNGKALIISSTDGFCTVATFEDNELGVPYKEPCTEENKTPSKLVKVPAANIEAVGKSPEAASNNNSVPALQNSEQKTPKRRKSNEPKTPHSSQASSPSNENRIAGDDMTRTLQESPDTQSHAHNAIIMSQQPELSDQVSSITLQGHKNDSSNEITEGENVETQVSKIKENEEVNKEGPKKKRIQITTLSLINKK